MHRFIIFLSTALFNILPAQPIYFGPDIVVDTTTQDLVEQAYPAMDIDANGNLGIVWTEELTPLPNTSRYYITSILSSDGGQSFHSKAFVETDPMPIFDYRNRTRVIYDNFGNPVVGWGNYSFENWGGWINLTKSLNGGISYPGPYYTAYSRERGYDFCFDEDNNFYFCWIDDWEGTIEFIKSTDGGITFDTARTVVDVFNMGWNPEGGPISLLLNSSNTIHIFWSTLSPRRRIWLSKSFDGGETFLTPDTIIDFQHQQNVSDVVVIDDEFYLIFWGFISPTNQNIYFSYSTNNGQNFSLPQIIGDWPIGKIHHNPLTGLLIMVGSKVYRSLDLGQTFPDTAIIQADPGYSVGAHSINSDQSGNVYAIGIRSKANTPGKRHIMLKKTDLLVGIPSESSPAIPAFITLKQNYPNPFNSSTFIEYQFSKQANVKLSIIDVTGKEIYRIERKNTPPGNHSFYWDGRTQYGNPAASGVYFYTLRVSDPGQTSQGRVTKKMLLIR
jgi:hypothetical protein